MGHVPFLGTSGNGLSPTQLHRLQMGKDGFERKTGMPLPEEGGMAGRLAETTGIHYTHHESDVTLQKTLEKQKNSPLTLSLEFNSR